MSTIFTEARRLLAEARAQTETAPTGGLDLSSLDLSVGTLHALLEAFRACEEQPRRNGEQRSGHGLTLDDLRPHLPPQAWEELAAEVARTCQ